MKDIKLTKNSSGIYDINFDDNGDFELVDGLETAILMSFYGWKRALQNEVAKPEFRRGWWGNEINTTIPNYEVGSKLWLLYESRITENNKNLAISYVRNGFEWLKEDNIVKDVEVDGEIEDNNINFTIKIIGLDDSVNTFYFNLLENTDLNNF